VTHKFLANFSNTISKHMQPIDYLKRLYELLGFDELREAIEDYERLLNAQADVSNDLPNSNDTEPRANEPSSDR
jgi:hypothetical protein